MVLHAQKITLDECAFDHIRPYIERIQGAKPDLLEKRVKDGLSICMAVFRGSGQVGGVMTSVERVGDEKWLIVNAYSCDPVRGHDMTAVLLKKMAITAKLTGCTGIRIWTERDGLRRKLEKIGATTRYVMEVKIDELT